MKIFIYLVFLLSFSCTKYKNQYTDYVDPFIGTAGFGHTFPGATLPFGMVQLSPDTRRSGWENCSGYHSSNPTILGFSHTHLSGTGAIDYGDILIIPTQGKIQFNPGTEEQPQNGYRSSFNKKTEFAKPGYYSVILDDHDIKAELTTSKRVGFHKYTYSTNDSINIIIDLAHGLGDEVLESELNVVSSTEISGHRISKGWANKQYVYFFIKFSNEITASQFELENILIDSGSIFRGKSLKGAFTFKTKSNIPLLAKVGISFVDINGAKNNLINEINHWNFEKSRKEANDIWESELSRVEVFGGPKEQKVNFYTSLYHAFIAPNLFEDFDSRYRGADLKIYKNESKSNIYTVFSLWDTFRALHPLFTILKPKLAQDLVKTLLKKYDHSGELPVWELAGNETGTMIGYHSVPVIVDAWSKGLRDFDQDKALEAMVNSAMDDKDGLLAYKRKGYISVESDVESVSKTLEYAYDDWCIAIMAKGMGKEKLANYFFSRSKNYKNLFDEKTGFMRPRKFSNWEEPFNPYEVSSSFTEANSWQYSYFAPHDLNGLIQLAGGDSIFSDRLDSLFNTSSDLSGKFQPDISGLIGQYAHGNEPSHNFAYLYNYIGRPWKTQERVKQILDSQYSNDRDGLCGNDDCGQMSAWYIFSSLGFYPVTPGKGDYIIGIPIFEKAIIHLDNNKTFTMNSQNYGLNNNYIQSIQLNNEKHLESYLSHNDITKGGEVKFTMGRKPNKSFAQLEKNRPSSRVNADHVLNPIIITSSQAFYETSEVIIKNHIEDGNIFFTLDNSTPTSNSPRYTNLIKINKSTTLKAITINSKNIKSKIEVMNFYKIPFYIDIDYNIPYSYKYTAGGERGLFDSIRGSKNSWGFWQGWEGTDFDVIIDLGKKRSINTISISTLHNPGSWIFRPEKIEFSESNDGQIFNKIDIIIPEKALNDYESEIIEFHQNVNEATRYIQIKVESIKNCPDWHAGKGRPSWLFIDEIIIGD